MTEKKTSEELKQVEELASIIHDAYQKACGEEGYDVDYTKYNELNEKDKIINQKVAKSVIDLTIQKLTEKHEADTLRASVEIKRLKNQINHICPQCDKNLKINGGNKIAYYYCQDCLKDETELYPKEKNQS